MGTAIGLSLSIALPLLAGTLWVRSLARDGDWPNWLVSLAYGYLIAAFATTLVMRVLDVAGIRWTMAWIALPMLVLAIPGYVLSRRPPSLRARGAAAWRSIALLPGWMRAMFWICLALIAVRIGGLALEVIWRPLLPFDAWAQWATKAKVWFEYGRLVPFVSADEWVAAATSLRFIDANSGHPAAVPLLQVWTDICIGHWDESLMNVPWLAAIVALALAFFAQLRRFGVAAVPSMAATYALISLPFLDIHVALAGKADLFIAAAYGMAAIALWQWSAGRKGADLLLAFAMALVCVMSKIEGVLWAATLLPGVIVAMNRRVGLTLVAVVALVGMGYLFFGPEKLVLFGYTLRTRFENVSLPLTQHMFVMDNWHLLWYAALAVVAWRRRRLLRSDFAPMTVTVLGACAFVFVVFFYTDASGGVDDESLVNRLLLHMVPALMFYLTLLVMDDDRRPARPLGRAEASRPSRPEPPRRGVAGVADQPPSAGIVGRRRIPLNRLSSHVHANAPAP